jgi:hypothetical protein
VQGLVAVVSASLCVFLVAVLVHGGLADRTASWGLPVGTLTVIVATAAVWVLVPSLRPSLLVPAGADSRLRRSVEPGCHTFISRHH